MKNTGQGVIRWDDNSVEVGLSKKGAAAGVVIGGSTGKIAGPGGAATGAIMGPED